VRPLHRLRGTVDRARRDRGLNTAAPHPRSAGTVGRSSAQGVRTRRPGPTSRSARRCTSPTSPSTTPCP
jgi:hypothetical protein